jgi:hypothetical protein
MSTPTVGENESSGTGGSRPSTRTRNIVVIGVLAAIVLGGVLVAGVLPSGDRAGVAATSCALEAGAANTCALGDVGPGGGVVFSVNESNPTGSRYLEAARVSWVGGSGDPKVDWDQAMAAASNYNGGGVSWTLPSIEQLNTLYEQKNLVGRFLVDFYWSSSEISVDAAWGQVFVFSFMIRGFKDVATGHARPVRAF